MPYQVITCHMTWFGMWVWHPVREDGIWHKPIWMHVNEEANLTELSDNCAREGGRNAKEVKKWMLVCKNLRACARRPWGWATSSSYMSISRKCGNQPALQSDTFLAPLHPLQPLAHIDAIYTCDVDAFLQQICQSGIACGILKNVAEIRQCPHSFLHSLISCTLLLPLT